MTTLADYDVRTTMATDLRDELRKANRELYDRWKREHKVWSPFSVEGFREALETEYLMGYSLSDIAMMYGLSRERVRQWFEAHDIWHEEERASLRVWDDEMDCFVPVSTDDYLERVRKIEKQRRAEARAWELEEKRRRSAQAVRELDGELGRPPTLEEVAEKVDTIPVVLAQWWGYTREPDTASYAEAWDRMYEAGGIDDRPHGDSTAEEGRHWGGGGGGRPPMFTADEADAIMEEWETTDATYPELADRYDCHRNTIFKHVTRARKRRNGGTP